MPTFHADWFSQNIPVWEKFLAHLKGREYIHGLEIGCWEGRSTCWLLQNIFTHPTSKMTVIDPFLGNPENIVEGYEEKVPEIFEANIKEIGASDRVTLHQMKSIDALRHMNLHDDSIDFAYIDGSHVTKDVLTDLCLTWPLVKKGGIIIMDDYGYAKPSMDAVPRHAIDIFQMIFRKEIIELHREWQMIWRKI
ncbi:MAG: hypothetical protein BWY42_00953 [Candidatus Omnitrophica bacterium ADurb.Bin277]|nr:MAG: hypothetical protein BWY42_00953 [Candidatus Omnitrophica bacterium ADurb.Bin277]